MEQYNAESISGGIAIGKILFCSKQQQIKTWMVTDAELEIARYEEAKAAALMFPMISSVEEVLEIKRICNTVKEDLKKEGISYKEIELGADSALTEVLVKMGIDELSVAPDRVLQIRKIIREMEEC